MQTEINIFEDDRWQNFLPLTYTRPVFDLRCGIFKLRQKIALHFYGKKIHHIMRKEIGEFFRTRFPHKAVNQVCRGPNLFINGTLLINGKIAGILTSLPENTGLFFGEICLGFKKNIDFDGELIADDVPELMKKILQKKADFKPINYIWELIEKNSQEIVSDFQKITKNKKNNLDKNRNFYTINLKEIFFAKNVTIEPNVVLDASQGPIFLDYNSTVMANAVIKGPAYIGKNSIVKIGAKIYSGTSIGKVCKVGGEIVETIFQGYSNKQHDGFIGNSYIGEFVNLGADTNNSNLKNNYKSVQVYFYPEKNFKDTQMQFFGMVIGDHSKTGINTMFNTGSVIGVGCNLYSADLFKGFIPSFSWGSAKKLYEYRISKMLATARIVKKRRDLELDYNEKVILEKCFINSSKLREIYHNKKNE